MVQQLPGIIAHCRRLPVQKISNRPPESGIGDPVGRVSEYRQKAPVDFMLALSARLKPQQALLNAIV